MLESGRSQWNGLVLGWEKLKLAQNFDGDISNVSGHLEHRNENGRKIFILVDY
jgi:hypothetical protein